jgi:hypothetical protein
MSLTPAQRGVESRGPEASMLGMSLLVDQLAGRCPAMRSIWAIGSRADGGMPDAQGPFDWDLVAFADASALRALRKATDLHRADVLLRVVIDGDRFEVAWGKLHLSGSLFQWDWRQTSEQQAYYSEARWTLPEGTGTVERVRRRAACLWRSEPGASRTASTSSHRYATRITYS